MDFKLINKKFIPIFIRSFFIQAVWNFKSLLSIGWTFSLIPVGKSIFKDEVRYKKFLYRHLSFFNAHPYFASFALGAIAKLEEDFKRSGEDDSGKIEKFKNAMIGPLGAVGDQLFWAVIKPACILVGFLGVLIMPELYQKLIFIFIFLILYNIPHIYIRYIGIARGYGEGLSIYRKLNMDNFANWQFVYSLIGGLAFSVIIGYLVYRSTQNGLIELVIFGMSFGIAFFLRSQRRMTYLPILIPLIISIIIGIII
jgi:mannose/fructose/N-acetylgalactosamine-specific phosphotransferase system component IID